MRFLLLLLLIGPSLYARQIDTSTVTQAAKLIGLSLTAAEKDSMVDGLKDNLQGYEKMRQQSIPNSLAYPFAFHPAPPGMEIPIKQIPVSWNIPRPQ